MRLHKVFALNQKAFPPVLKSRVKFTSVFHFVLVFFLASIISISYRSNNLLGGDFPSDRQVSPAEKPSVCSLIYYS